MAFRFFSAARRGALLLAISLAACASPTDAEEDAGDDVRFDGLTADDAESAAAAYLAKHDALGTDFERRENEGAHARSTPAPQSTGLRPASVEGDLEALASAPGTWSWQMVRVDASGATKTLASVASSSPVMGASTFKLFTAWTALSNRAAQTATLTTMLRMSDNRLAQLVMCRNGEVLARYDAPCVARETPTAAMRIPEAAEATRAFLVRDGVALSTSFAQKDGAGLAEDGLLTVDDLMHLLLRIHRDPRAPAFRAMLAQPGVSSTLRSRFRGLQGKLFAKTGTYVEFGGGVKALAGYAMLPSRRTLVFAIVGNHVGDPNVAMGAIERAVTNAIAHADDEP